MPRAGYPRRGAEGTKPSLRHVEYQRLDNNNEPSVNKQIPRHESSKKGLQWLCQVSVIIPILLTVTFLISAEMIVTGLTFSEPAPPASSYLELSAVPGFFLQDEPGTDPETFDFASANFGLINRSYETDPTFDPEQIKTHWERFAHYVNFLNKESQPAGTVLYKVLFLGRHGEGYHNVAERFYGTEAWDCYWSLQDGNGTLTWADARLTPLGEAQAHLARSAWKMHLARKKTTKQNDDHITGGIPFPQSFYVSPLTRCLETARITFEGLDGGIIATSGTSRGADPFRPIVKELLRETLGIHTCDRRSDKSLLTTSYPSYRFEQDFAESDPLWDPEWRESNSARDLRLLTLLRDILTTDVDATFVSLTAHSGAISSLLNVIGHRPFAIKTGAVMPVFVSGEVVEGEKEPERRVDPPSRAPTCHIEEGGKSQVQRWVVEVKNASG